jgi:ABC-2 type transport system permease protein
MTNRLRMVAEKDFRDSFRERQFYYVAAIFLLFGLAIGYLAGSNADGTNGDDVFGLVLAVLVFLGPLVTLTISHDAVAEKWATGELTVLLGLPFARSDVVYGSAIGRTAVVGTVCVLTIVASMLVAGVFGVFPALGLLVVGTLSLVVTVAIFASLAVTFSVLSPSTRISATGAFGVFVLFGFQIWGLLPSFVNFALDRLGMGTISQDTIDVWNNLTPYAAVRNLFGAMVESVGDPYTVVAPAWSPASPPAYQDPIVAALLIAFWVLVPLTLAYRRFATTDV